MEILLLGSLFGPLSSIGPATFKTVQLTTGDQVTVIIVLGANPRTLNAVANFPVNFDIYQIA
ncbi:hypothetical protein C6A34_13670 (plasmid) [Bacillus thuringiensis]|nr:hypothetical protein C6A34_13670 [Bacillus thuringiensis]